jgi:hypothetical protein
MQETAIRAFNNPLLAPACPSSSVLPRRGIHCAHTPHRGENGHCWELPTKCRYLPHDPLKPSSTDTHCRRANPHAHHACSMHSRQRTHEKQIRAPRDPSARPSPEPASVKLPREIELAEERSENTTQRGNSSVKRLAGLVVLHGSTHTILSPFCHFLSPSLTRPESSRRTSSACR